jgi:PAS domain S-box-containing protein
VSLVLTVGIVSFVLPAFVPALGLIYSIDTSVAAHALAAMVLLFDVYVIFQQVQIYRFRKQIAEREELFRLIGENAADMIAVVDVSGRRLYNSPSYERLLGYSREELGQTSSFEQIHPDDREKVSQAAKEAQRLGVGRSVEYRIRHKDGHWLTLESTASVVRNNREEVEKLVVVNRDVTERKKLAEQIQLSHRLEAIGRLSGGVAHDFNNLLGVIIGYSEALQKRMPASDPHREAIDEIYNAGKRAASLTQQLLAFSRKQVLEPQVLDLNAIVAEAEKMVRRLVGEDILLKLSLSPFSGMIKADRGQVERVLLNLIVNARDAMPQGGRLTIETAYSQLDEENINRQGYVIPGNYIVLKVADTGCGMDVETQAHIFEPFFTTKEVGKGTGLGLATVYGVIKQSGGYIWVESETGKGATFTIYFPQVQAVANPVPENKPSCGRKLQTRTVLLVEDEHSLRKLTRDTLRDLGYTVFEAQHGAEALEIAAHSKAPIDLLLTDVIMPGMSGRQLADTLSPLRPEMRILYMSGYTDGVIASRGILESGTLVLRKPFTQQELAQCVEGVLVGVSG